MTALKSMQKVPQDKVLVGLQRLPHGLDLPIPSYATLFSAGLDLYAAVDQDLVLDPQTWLTIPTGIAIALPQGFEGQIRSRSGLAAKHGLAILNAPGTIDADYRGELKGILMNHGSEPFTITRGLRFAQLVIAPVASTAWEEFSTLDQTARGAGGFGSTGT